MLDLKTPLDRLFRLNLELDASVTNLVEGEWISPHKDAGKVVYVRTGTGNAAPNVAFQAWLDQKRPDSYSSSMIGSGTTVSPFGKYIAETDIFDHTKAYTPGVALTVAVVANQSVLTPVTDPATEVVYAVCISAPANVTPASAKIKYVVQ